MLPRLILLEYFNNQLLNKECLKAVCKLHSFVFPVSDSRLQSYVAPKFVRFFWNTL